MIMKELINKLKCEENNLRSLIWVLEGGDDETNTVSDALDIYSDLPDNMQEVFDELREKHGNDYLH